MNYFQIPYTHRLSTGEQNNFKFRNWKEFQQNLKIRLDKNISYSCQKDSKQRKSGGFNDTESLDAACQELTKEKKLQKDQAEQLFEIQKKSSKLYFSDTPFDAIDVPSFLSGGPDYWTGFTSSNRKSKKKISKNIFLAVNALGDVSTKDLNNYLLKSLIDIYNNYLFEKVVITAASKEDDNIRQFYIDVSHKEVSMIFRTGFSDFFRRIVFFFREQDSTLTRGYGRTINRKELKELNGENCEVFSYYS
jgi:hypothetical protein